jgi:hypothetical protein
LSESAIEQYIYKIKDYVFPPATDARDRRRVHQDYLFDRVDLRRPKHAAAAHKGDHGAGVRPPAGVASAEAEKVEMIGLLEWDETDLDRIKDQFVWSQVPDTLAVRLAQEDLWVYEALLRIIENTNKGTTYDNAAIKRVEALEIGRQAAHSWGQATEPVISGLSSAAGAAGAGRRPGAATPAPFAAGGAAAHPAPHHPGDPAHHGAEEQGSPLADRYVDDSGNPLAENAKHPYAEFKMMPINLRLVIHQKKIPKLLTECANSNMPIVVRGVRFRPGHGEVISAGGAAAGGAGHGATNTPPPGAPQPPGAAASAEGAAAETAGSPYLPVELRGIIYIYNPPDLNKVGTSSTVGESGAAPAGSPAAAGTSPPGAAAGSPAAPANRGGQP